MPRTKLARIIDTLARAHGEPGRPATHGPFEMILWENVAYLVDDERRLRAFEALREKVGLGAEAILDAPDDALLEVVSTGGILPAQRVEKLRAAARITVSEFGGSLDALLELPAAAAMKALARFPGIGAPGAEKILLFCGARPVLALESNGLRVLVRLGYGKEQKSYAATYRSAREAAASELPAGCAPLARAHLLLREHGRKVCRRASPLCETCPVAAQCLFFRARTR